MLANIMEIHLPWSPRQFCQTWQIWAGLNWPTDTGYSRLSHLRRLHPWQLWVGLHFRNQSAPFYAQPWLLSTTLQNIHCWQEPDYEPHSQPQGGQVEPSYLKKPQDVGNHDRDRACSCTNDSNDFIWLGKYGLVSIGTAYIRTVTLNESLYKGKRLLQGVGVPRAGVQDTGSQRHIGQQFWVFVDEVDGKQHCLQSVNAFLLL